MLGTYGATEFAGAIAGWTLKDKKQWGPRKRGSVGRAHHGIELRIVDPDTGAVLPAGTDRPAGGARRQLPGRGRRLAADHRPRHHRRRGVPVRPRAGGRRDQPRRLQDPAQRDRGRAGGAPSRRRGVGGRAAGRPARPGARGRGDAAQPGYRRGTHGVPHQQADQVPAAGRDQGGGPAAADAIAQDQPRARPRALLRRSQPARSHRCCPAPRRQESPSDRRRTGRVRRPHR